MMTLNLIPLTGAMGPRGIMGLKGDPGESISIPEAMVSPSYCLDNSWFPAKAWWVKISFLLLGSNVAAPFNKRKYPCNSSLL